MNKKSLLLIVLLLLAVTVLAGCKPTVTPTEEPMVEDDMTEEPMTDEEMTDEEPMVDEGDPYAAVDPTGAEVVFWHQHSKERETALLEIVDEFNATNEWGITVTAEYQGGYGDIFNKMLGVVGTADAPELVVAYQNQAATYALVDGALIDMNLLVESPTWGLTEEEKADFFPGFYNQDIFPTFDNARYGFPPNRSEEMLYYNIDWLNELYAAGAIDFEGPPTTPEQFAAAACAATENPFSAATGDAATTIGYELSVDASRFASWTFAFGGDIFDYEAGQYALDDPAAVEAWTFLQGLFADGCAKIVTENYGDQTNFGAGTTLFTVGSSSGLPYYASAVAEGSNHQWSVAAIPHTTADPVQNIYGASVTIPTTTPEQELAAWLFIKYYTSPEVQGKWAAVSQYFPVRASAVAYLADTFASIPGYETAFDLLQYGAVEPPVPGYDFVRTMMEERMAALAADPAMDVAAEFAALNEDANAELADLLAD